MSLSTKNVDSANKKKQFRWTDKMIESVITSLHKFKSVMEYKNLDFDGDRTVQYSWLRKELACVNKNDELFGPVSMYSPPIPLSDVDEEQKTRIQSASRKGK